MSNIEWNKNNPAPGSETVDLGTYLHSLVLEPDKFQYEYAKAPEFDCRTNKGKADKEAFYKTMENSGREVIEHDQWQMLLEMEKSVKAHPTANNLLYSEGVSELSIFSEINGIPVKARPDRVCVINGQHYVVDLKKTINLDDFAKSIMKFRYHVQSSFYSDVYEKLTGHKPRFVFVAVAQTKSIGRHEVGVFELPQEVKDLGRTKYLEDLELCREFDEFGSNGLDIETINIPSYLLK